MDSVWAKFVLITSVVLFLRYGTLLARLGLRKPIV